MRAILVAATAVLVVGCFDFTGYHAASIADGGVAEDADAGTDSGDAGTLPACGELGEDCCWGVAPCSASACDPASNKCVACRGEGQACCTSGGNDTGCDEGLECVSQTCRCGVAGVVCCGGNACRDGSTCTDGRCVGPRGPFLVAAQEDGPQGIASDGSIVYWERYGNGSGRGSIVRKRPIDTAPTIFVPQQRDLGDLVISGGYLYWTKYLGLSRTHLDSGGEEFLATLPDGSPGPLAVDGTEVWFTVDDYQAGAVGRWRPGETTPEILVDGLGHPNGIALDPTYAWFTDEKGLSRIDRSTGKTELVAPIPSNDSYAWGVVSTSAGLYWMGYNALYFTAAGTSGAPEVIDNTHGGNEGAIATDGSHVYWAGADSSLLRVAVGGHDVEIIALHPGEFRRLAVDATSVYWTDFFGGTVWKVDKP